MSRPYRRHVGGPAPRPRRKLQIEAVQPLEERQLLTPFMTVTQTTATFTAAATPTNPVLGTVTITQGAPTTTSAAGFTSVAQLTPISSFGGDIVRIEAGPGGDFGKGVYAISRGAGSNQGAINRPGVIYRVDPATGKASVFFDLNTVIAAQQPGGTAANSAGAETGLVNWYDITFDPEGYFDGKTSMFVTSVDRVNPDKNVIFRIGSDGSFLGAYIKFTEGAGAGTFSRMPSAAIVPPPEQQQFLRGLIAGDASGDPATSTGYIALFFDANQFRPGTDLNSPNLPPGVSPTGLFFGPQVGLTSSSTNFAYPLLIYSAFTNFGTPAGPGIAAQPGLSGVQGLNGSLLINGGVNIVTSYTDPNAATPDATAAIITPFRRFQDIAFDAYGYFSYGTSVTANPGQRPTFGNIPPTYVGSMFVADLATGLTVNVTPVDPLDTTPVNIPIQGPGTVGVELDPNGNVVPIVTNGNTTGGSNIGGRIVRIAPDGTLTNFAEGFNTSGNQGSQSFIDSSLSITFSADGTTLYASDNDGIWQFKSVLSLAGSSTGTLTGLNDLRSLGIPYEGQDSAVAVLDTGVDALTPNFRGRVSTGKNIVTGGNGNDDPTAAQNGHGTLVAGVVAQFVPQATIQPVNVFTPNFAANTTTTGTTSQLLYNGMQFITQNPYAKDPIRPNKADRIVATAIGIGTNSTFDTEGVAFRKYPQVVLALKSQLSRMRRLGIAPVVAAGQLGVPVGDVQADPTLGDPKGMALPAVLNEAISVTGTYPFPFNTSATSTPNDPQVGVLPRPVGPLTQVGNNANASTGAELIGNELAVTTGDNIIFADKLLVASNRNNYTDYAAPAVDVPTFRRTFAGDGNDHNVFNEGGTSLSAGIVAGSFALVTSAIDYWVDLAHSNDGATADAYLTQPVGVNRLTFGSHGILDLSLYANPDAVNGILQWTAVPATDAPNSLDNINPPALFGNPNYRNYSRIDVGNAIAAIEGAVALDYLFAHGTFDVIDGNDDGLVTAAEIQRFVDQSSTIGMPEAGAMARLLGGVASIPLTGFQPTAAGELPDQPDVLQRRFNFFDYAADGVLNGSVSIQQLNVLAHKLLPAPDTFTVTDRQRSANNGYLVSPQPDRNYSQLNHMLPKYTWVPRSLAKKFERISPGRYGVGRGLLPANTAPLYTLFEPHKAKASTEKSGSGRSGQNPGSGNGSNTTGGSNGSTTGNGSGNTGNTSTSTGGTTTTPTNTDTRTTPQDNQAQKFIDAVIDAINGRKSGATTSPGTPQPAGTLTPIAPDSSTTTPSTVAGDPQKAVDVAVPNTATGATPTTLASTTSSSTSDSARQTQAEAHQARVEHRQEVRQDRIEKAREAARIEALRNKDETGWDWVKNNLFNPGKWFD
jgi:hypothetical protein